MVSKNGRLRGGSEKRPDASKGLGDVNQMVDIGRRITVLSPLASVFFSSKFQGFQNRPDKAGLIVIGEDTVGCLGWLFQ
jgi:hypothetical protein